MPRLMQHTRVSAALECGREALARTAPNTSFNRIAVLQAPPPPPLPASSLGHHASYLRSPRGPVGGKGARSSRDAAEI